MMHALLRCLVVNPRSELDAVKFQAALCHVLFRRSLYCCTIMSAAKNCVQVCKCSQCSQTSANITGIPVRLNITGIAKCSATLKGREPFPEKDTLASRGFQTDPCTYAVMCAAPTTTRRQTHTAVIPAAHKMQAVRRRASFELCYSDMHAIARIACGRGVEWLTTAQVAVRHNFHNCTMGN